MIEMIVCRALELVIVTVTIAFSIHCYFRLQKEIEENKIKSEILNLKKWREFGNCLNNYKFKIVTEKEIIYEKI